MRELYLDNGNEQFKFADTTTEIRLNAFDNGRPASLTTDARVRIKNDSGYLLEVSANTTKNQAIITSGQLAKLPVGSYLLERWLNRRPNQALCRCRHLDCRLVQGDHG